MDIDCKCDNSRPNEISLNIYHQSALVEGIVATKLIQGGFDDEKCFFPQKKMVKGRQEMLFRTRLATLTGFPTPTGVSNPNSLQSPTTPLQISTQIPVELEVLVDYHHKPMLVE